MSPAADQTKEFDIVIKQVPVTEQRKPFVQKDGDFKLEQPGTARANEAASVDAPVGTEKSNYSKNHRDETVLQQHVAFFDSDHDGVIWPLDTYRGFRQLGFNVFLSLLSLVIIHANFSYPTVSGFLPDPFFRVYTERIHKDKHGSDSGTYDNEGRYIPQKFEDIFAKYAGSEEGKDKEGLTLWEALNLMKGQRVIFDPFGWGGASFEWLATYILLWPEDGRMKKEDIRRVYDGSLFYEVAARRAKEKK